VTPDAVERIAPMTGRGSGTIVMGTGIVSVALSLDGRATLSRILLVICAAVWVSLAILVGARLLRDPEQVWHRAHSPAALTSVAGTETLGSALAILGWTWAAIALLALGLVLWLVLLGPVLTEWIVPTSGVSLLLTVSTESLAVLAAALAATEGAPWLLDCAMALFVLGLGCYVFVICRFDFRQLIVAQGDHWITGGALAISTLAVARITLAARTLHLLMASAEVLKVATLTLWGLSIAWLPVLLVAEAARPRLVYDLRRWATVFPIGMYAACSFLTAAAAQSEAIADFAKVWVWLSVAVWLIVFLATLARVAELTRSTPGADA
jgi:tellurite resistance protein TehA-like permease